jgi:hypothetical protein
MRPVKEDPAWTSASLMLTDPWSASAVAAMILERWASERLQVHRLRRYLRNWQGDF